MDGVKLPNGSTLIRSGVIQGLQRVPQPISANLKGKITETRIVRPKMDPAVSPVAIPKASRGIFVIPEVPKTPIKTATPNLDIQKPREYNFDINRSREEHIQYFKDLVDEEINYMKALADHYEGINKKIGPDSAAPRINQDAGDLILSAVGQARLLSSKKIQQFVGLIDDCEFHRGDHPSEPTDLAGFWEMINMQVMDIHKKFDSLGALARNDWKTPAKSTVDGTKVAKKAPLPAKKSGPSIQASSKIREAIQAARRNKSASETSNESSVDVV